MVLCGRETRQASPDIWEVGKLRRNYEKGSSQKRGLKNIEQKWLSVGHALVELCIEKFLKVTRR